MSFILQNPFYYGHFRYTGEIHEGKHEPLITKDLWDRANAVLRGRGRRPSHQDRPEAILRASAVRDVRYEYYRREQVEAAGVRQSSSLCLLSLLQKSKTMSCDEPCIRGEVLDRQLSALLTDYAMPKEWVSPLSEMLDREAQTATQTASEAVFRVAGASRRAISQSLSPYRCLCCPRY